MFGRKTTTNNYLLCVRGRGSISMSTSLEFESLIIRNKTSRIEAYDFERFDCNTKSKIQIHAIHFKR